MSSKPCENTWAPDANLKPSTNFVSSHIHSVDSGQGEEGGVRDADCCRVLGNINHLSLVDGHGEACGATIHAAGVQTVHDSQASHLVVTFRLQESLVCLKRVVWDALGNVCVVEIVTLGAVDAVHIVSLQIIKIAQL